MHFIIDPHVHFFDVEKGEYSWLHPSNPPFWPDKALINQNVGPEHLQLSADCQLKGAVHIEAGFNNEDPKTEVDWLESQVYLQAPNLDFKTIGYINIRAPSDIFKEQLLALTSCHTLVGVRCIFGDISPLSEQAKNISKNLKSLTDAQLLFEFQADFTNTNFITNMLNMLMALPELKVVVNHAGLPPLVNSKDFITWQTNIKSFAQLPNSHIKCSGFEMTSREYTAAHVCSVLSVSADAFGYERMMLASNFPLTLFTLSYAQYWKFMIACAKQVGLPIKKVSCTNAKDLYLFP